MIQGADLRLLEETDNLDDQPRLSTFEQFVFELFWRLHTERSFGMHVGPIPGGKIFEYFDRIGVDGAMGEEIAEIILAMDKTYLSAKVREAERASK